MMSNHSRLHCRLDRTCYYYCGEITSRDASVYHILFHSKKNKMKPSQWKWNYPATACISSDSYGYGVSKNYSRDVRDTSYNSKLANHLKFTLHVTHLGECSPLTKCKNGVGRCAEPHAANKTINKTLCSINDIIFSLALRPRTLQIIPYCDNCKLTFNL